MLYMPNSLGNDMKELSEEEQKEILESSPKGTWVIMFIYGILFTLGFLYFWFGLFVARGPIN